MNNKSIVTLLGIALILIVAGVVTTTTDRLGLFGHNNGVLPVLLGIIVFVVGLVCFIFLRRSSK